MITSRKQTESEFRIIQVAFKHSVAQQIRDISGPSLLDQFLQRGVKWQQPPGPALSVFEFTAGDPSPLAPQLTPPDWSSRSLVTQQSLRSKSPFRGGEIFWGSGDIDCRATSKVDSRTKALRTLIIFRGCHKARDFNSADSKAA